MNASARRPVIIGVGQTDDRTEDPMQAKDACALMLEALLRANDDAGGSALRQLDTLELVRLFSAPMDHIPGELALALPGLRSTPEFREGHGNTPLLLLSMAANRIAAGEAELCAIAGAEAYRTEKRLAEAAAGGVRPDMMQRTLESRTTEVGRKYRVVTPIEIYPLFENAMRSRWGQSLADAQAESARIWSDFSRIAADNPNAWIRRRYAPEEILATGPANRKLNFPYSTLMVANNSVNQGAAVILASYAMARSLGVPDDRMIFVGESAAAKESHDFLERQDYHSSPSIRATVRLALERNRVEATECDHLELYSCFPCVPKYVRREFGFRSDLPLSVAGGLTFAGGPIRNYMMHATAAMVERLRKSGNYGLLFGNGGFMTDAHVVVLGRQPLAAASLPSSFDVQEQADALRGPVPRYVDGYVGPGSIETYTVAHDRDGRPRFGTVIGRTDSGDRFVCRAEAEDADLMSFLMSGAVDPIGERGRVEQRGDGFLVWRMP